MASSGDAPDNNEESSMGFPTGCLLAALVGVTIAGSSDSSGPGNGNGGGGAVGTVSVGNIFFQSGHNTGSGQTYSLTFTTPGTYQYDCEVHGEAMSGRIVVR
jgi:hypothetical protein